MEILATLRSTRLPPSFIFFKKKMKKVKRDLTEMIRCRVAFALHFPQLLSN